ncbi:MAG TPA: hypothetical protein VH144_03425 [Candidatus Saccharimonadales bacterium]|jgi:hypothetical protein|nr:hypothetical protein [Candidatus Saccharimonadales bacterium]
MSIEQWHEPRNVVATDELKTQFNDRDGVVHVMAATNLEVGPAIENFTLDTLHQTALHTAIGHHIASPVIEHAVVYRPDKEDIRYISSWAGKKVPVAYHLRRTVAGLSLIDRQTFPSRELVVLVADSSIAVGVVGNYFQDSLLDPAAEQVIDTEQHRAVDLLAECQEFVQQHPKRRLRIPRQLRRTLD